MTGLFLSPLIDANGVHCVDDCASDSHGCVANCIASDGAATGDISTLESSTDGVAIHYGDSDNGCGCSSVDDDFEDDVGSHDRDGHDARDVLGRHDD